MLLLPPPTGSPDPPTCHDPGLQARYQDTPCALKEISQTHEIEIYLSAGVHDNIVGLRGLCKKDKVGACSPCGGLLWPEGQEGRGQSLLPRWCC
jgi:hypothetical protein